LWLRRSRRSGLFYRLYWDALKSSAPNDGMSKNNVLKNSAAKGRRLIWFLPHPGSEWLE
jgi:hypothetical protein